MSMVHPTTGAMVDPASETGIVTTMQTAEALAPALEIDIRPMEEEDESFVYGSWLNHMLGRNGSEYARKVNSRPHLGRKFFWETHHLLIERILARPSCRVYVATIWDAEDIAGYLVTDAMQTTPIIHFGYTKHAFQGHGVMKRILSASGLDPNECIWTHPAKLVEAWAKVKWPGLQTLDIFR
jgi:hypothetical protein